MSLSLRKSINEKCRECIYDEYGGGTWREQIEACTSPGCPLYGVRPISTKSRRKTAVLASSETIAPGAAD